MLTGLTLVGDDSAETDRVSRVCCATRWANALFRVTVLSSNARFKATGKKNGYYVVPQRE